MTRNTNEPTGHDTTDDTTTSGITTSPAGAPATTASGAGVAAADRPTTALVTGANKGIGFEIAAGLGALGWSVGVGARDDARREAAVQRLRDAGYDAFGVPLDVTDDDSVAAAAALLEERGGLDVLVNNAGITGGMPQLPSEVTVEQLRSVLDVNVFGALRMMRALLPQLRRSAHPRVVSMSSGVGSLTRQAATSDPLATGPVSGAYSPSKTYLNAVTLQFVKELAQRGEQRILVNLACPGFVATDLNGFAGVRSPQEGARIAIRLATLPDDGPTGGYFEDAGSIPW